MPRYLRSTLAIGLALLLIWSLGNGHVAAQDEATPTPAATNDDPLVPKIHIIEAGQTLTTIAALYEVTVEDILLINNLDNADAIFAGQEIVIPGAVGDRIPTFYTAGVGDTLVSLAARFNVEPADIVGLNRLVSAQLVAGQRIGLLSGTGSTEPLPLTGRIHVVTLNETLLSLSLKYGLRPAELAQYNGLAYPQVIFSGQRLLIPDETATYEPLSGYWSKVEIGPLPIVPGESVKILVASEIEGEPNGHLGSQTLRFSQTEGGWLAIVGIEPYAPIGLYELELGGNGNRPWPTLRETLLVDSIDYGTQPITVPDSLSAILDPNVRAAEDAFLEPLFAQFNGAPRWDGTFLYPTTTQLTSSPYGSLRSYNGGPYDIYHTGLDFPLATGSAVFSPAAATVIWTGELQVRGNVIILDHGAGVMSAYYHLSRIDVEIGQELAAGVQIGLVGNSGLSSGAHLHWDIRIMNVPVNPVQWLSDWVP